MRLKLAPADKRKHTCFGLHYSGIFKIIPVGEFVTTGPCLVLFFTDYILHSENWRDANYFVNNDVYFYLRMTGLLWFSVQVTLNFLLNILLFRQSVSPNVTHLLYYAFFSSASFLAFAIYLWILNFSNNWLASIYIFGVIPILTIYRLIVSYFVYRFALDIAEELRLKSGYRDLTSSEVDSFENGLGRQGDNSTRSGSNGKQCLRETLPYLRYNREEFEIPLENLDFSEGSILGFGEYGLVYKGWLQRRDMEGKSCSTRTAVAVKTVDPNFSNVTHFSALLSEAKLMTYLGKHENVVELIGLYTREISTRKLYIICELCGLGNLRAYLRSVRNTFVDLLSKDHERPELDPLEEDKVDTKDLVRWCLQIASGMDFLGGQKRVVHGDLALRNVLLTESKTAKITDFGLSRRLYTYDVYVKKNKMPLPWRTLAIESLVDMHFSLKSDVWSYGVCCWEIFELGGKAWPDYLEYSLDFVHNVKNGKRMEQPSYCPDEIYGVMLACWNPEQSSRPQFSDIMDTLRDYKLLTI